MVNNDSSQVVKTTVGVAEPGAGEVPQQVVAHVQARQGKLNKRVNLGPGCLRPTEPRMEHSQQVKKISNNFFLPFNMKTEDSWQSPDTELLGAGLLRLTGSTVKPLTVRQLFFLHKLLETVVDITDRLLFLPLFCLPHRPPVGRWDVDGKVQEGIVRLAGLVAGETGDAGLEGPAEDRRDDRVGLRPQHPHLVVHTGQQVEQLSVKSEAQFRIISTPGLI